MSNNAVKSNDKTKLKNTRIRIAKRAIFLFVVGLLYTPIWIADILHFYGIYMLLTLLLISSSRKLIFNVGLLLILIYPLLMLLWNYDTGWNFETFVYSNFWSVSGFFRNLFYNGFHPVIPWTAFMLLGLWFGKQNLSDERFIKKSILVSISVFIVMLLISKVSIFVLSEGDQTALLELKCQGAPKLYHLGALQSVPPLIKKIFIFSWNKTGEHRNGKQVKDGTETIIIQSICTRLVKP